MINELVVATHNQGKVEEFKVLMKDLPIEIKYLADFDAVEAPAETGRTFAANARQKATYYAKKLGKPCIADDSGLEVAALQGAPGILSHRYAPKPNATDADRCAYLLSRLAPHPKPWVAAFHCEVVLYTGVGTAYNAHGICPGFIIEEPRGDNGFGYDPIFVLEGATQTMAELDNVTKNTLSHRARALQTAMPFLSDFANS